MQVELEVLKVLIENQKKIIKRGGSDWHKIYRMAENCSKEEVKIAIENLLNKKLIVKTKIALANNGSEFASNVYRINDKGIDFYEKEKYDMERNIKIEKLVNKDLNVLTRIEDSKLKLDYKEMQILYIELTSRYHDLIAGLIIYKLVRTKGKKPE